MLNGGQDQDGDIRRRLDSLTPAPRRVLLALLEKPGAKQSEVAKSLSLSLETVRDYGAILRQALLDEHAGSEWNHLRAVMPQLRRVFGRDPAWAEAFTMRADPDHFLEWSALLSDCQKAAAQEAERERLGQASAVSNRRRAPAYVKGLVGVGAVAFAALVIAAFLGVKQLRAGSPCTPNSRFVDDVTVPDGQTFSPADPFTKQWHVQNPPGSGLCTWGPGYNVFWTDGPNLSGRSSYDVPSTKPGMTITISIPMAAPSQPGTYKSVWSLRDNKGRKFGDPFWVIINVK